MATTKIGTKSPATITAGGVKLDVTTPETIAESVVGYGAASTGDKTKIRNAVQSGMTESVKAMDLPTAQAWSALGDAIAAAGTKVTEKVDVSQVVADRALALMYAAHRLIMGDVAPDGIDADEVDTDRVQAIVKAFTDQADPDAVTTEIGEAGNKIARTKITRSTVRGSVEAHIETAFDGMPVGTRLTVAQIRTRSGAASDGAIAARLWPRAKADGTVPEVTLDLVALGVEKCDIDGTRGLVKVA